MVNVLPAGICKAPSTLQLAPVEKVVLPAVLSKINILSEAKLLGFPPVPSGFPVQLEVLVKAKKLK